MNTRKTSLHFLYTRNRSTFFRVFVLRTRVRLLSFSRVADYFLVFPKAHTGFIFLGLYIKRD